MEFALGVSSDDWEVADEAKYVATDAVDSYMNSLEERWLMRSSATG